MLRLISDILGRRRLRRHARDTMRAARHILNMREDIMAPADVRSLRAEMERLSQAMQPPAFPNLTPAAIDTLGGHLSRLAAPRPAAVAREYVEVLVVAVSVAVAFKTYFFQPFKIPTGSMQPTLYGVHVSEDAPRPFVYFPAGRQVHLLRLPGMDVNGFSERTAITGERYCEVRAMCSGVVGYPYPDANDPTVTVLPVGGQPHRLPVGPSEFQKKADSLLLAKPGQEVSRGDLLCRATAIAGDHVLVNRMALNFRRPRRDDVIVFGTSGIEGLVQGTHYIKRLVGLPNERIGVQPPNLVIDGKPVTGYRGIDRVTRDPAYQGYQLPNWNEAGPVMTTNSILELGPKQYAGFGDNTGNSRDSRYWGAIPERNLVGPATFVYWPFSKRWGLIR